MRERIAKAVYAPGAKLRTEGVIELEELSLAGADRIRYKALGWSVLPRILSAREVSDDDVFIDYGSGMGRLLYLAAARYPFRRVIGLELSEQLNEIARANLGRNAHRLRCSDIQLHTGDVLEYEPPPDITVAFFNNPFTGKTFETAVERLLDAAHRPLRIIYCNPIEHEVLMATGRLEVVRRLRGWRPGQAWSRSNTTIMYRTLPGRAGGGAGKGSRAST
ncbi:MAG: class I SAM-dependent methyltransferase [Solirubrobacterales bacterium]|nr:class I SAM-dependent methyltransferase [Solirubrobacterales bacterium]